MAMDPPVGGVDVAGAGSLEEVVGDGVAAGELVEGGVGLGAGEDDGDGPTHPATSKATSRSGAMRGISETPGGLQKKPLETLAAFHPSQVLPSNWISDTLAMHPRTLTTTLTVAPCQASNSWSFCTK